MTHGEQRKIAIIVMNCMRKDKELKINELYIKVRIYQNIELKKLRFTNT
jgi:hypothetical protein